MIATPLGIRDLFADESRWQSWLDVEAALATAQARLGTVPVEAARTIASVAHFELMDRARIDEAAKRTGHALVPIVWELARIAGEESGGWVHWGATSQNIMQTGELIILRKVHGIIRFQVDEVLETLSHLGSRSASMPMAGRTHGQHAVPMTFGFKVAAWIDEFLRHAERLVEVEKRLFQVLMGGAVGTFAAAGDSGPLVQEAVADILSMKPMRVASRSINDHFAEYVCILGLIAGTGGKIARELYALMKTEFAEVEEPMAEGSVGSSTMPQKRNPHLCQDVLLHAAGVRSCVAPALEAMQTEHESDRAMSLIMQESVDRACVETGDMLSRLKTVLAGLRLSPDRMRSNLAMSGGLIMAEAVMMRIAGVMGRQLAHDIVHEAATKTALGGRSFVSFLLDDERVSALWNAEEIEEMLEPTAYLGESQIVAMDASARALRAARSSASSSNPPEARTT